MISKEEAKKMVEGIRGEARGVAIKDDLDYILEIKGKEGLQKIESRMERLGYSLKRKDVVPMGFYPMGLANLYLLVIKEVFNFNNDDLEQWGAGIVKFSIFTKIFMKYFGSLKLVSIEAGKNWSKHYTIGRLEMPDYSEKERYAFLKLYDFKLDPIHCYILLGYFQKISSMVVKNKVTCRETKCMFRDDPYHEFSLTW